MPLTKRDIEILKFINEFGFCDMKQLMNQFGIKQSWLYEIMQKLTMEKWVKRYPLFHRQVVFTVTAKGANYTDLPSTDRISKGRYDHQMMLTDVYIKLQRQYPEAYWMSERRLKQDKYHDGLGKFGHVADGLLIFPDGKEIAIEVEISVKGKNRMEKILKDYATQFHIHEVWYFCLPRVIPILKKLTENMPFIKINNVTEYLHDAK